MIIIVLPHAKGNSPKGALGMKLKTVLTLNKDKKMSLKPFNITGGETFYLDPDKINLITIVSDGMPNKAAIISFADCSTLKLDFIGGSQDAYDWINENLIS